MRHALWIICTLFSFAIFAQQNIPLPAAIANPVAEYSAMTLAGNRLLLVPQYPDNNALYAIDTNKLLQAISQGKPVSFQKFSKIVLPNFESVKQAINANGDVYEGVEAVVAVGNTVFFSIETTESTDSCFIVKGYLHKNSITLDSRHLQAIKKITCDDKRVSNAGYESLTYLPDQHKLLAVFEYTNTAAVYQTPVAWLIDTTLKDEQPAPVYIEQPIPFRISDICNAGAGQLYGLNFWWAGEYKDYFSCNQQTRLPIADSAAFTNTSHKNTCYARILQLQLTGNTLHWASWKEIGYDCYNWEGIAALHHYLFIVSDANKGKYAEKTTHFSAFSR